MRAWCLVLGDWCLWCLGTVYLDYCGGNVCDTNTSLDYLASSLLYRSASLPKRLVTNSTGATPHRHADRCPTEKPANAAADHRHRRTTSACGLLAQVAFWQNASIPSRTTRNVNPRLHLHRVSILPWGGEFGKMLGPHSAFGTSLATSNLWKQSSCLNWGILPSMKMQNQANRRRISSLEIPPSARTCPRERLINSPQSSGCA